MKIRTITARSIRYGIKLAYRYIDKGLVTDPAQGQKMIELITQRYGVQSLITKAFTRKVRQYVIRQEIHNLALRLNEKVAHEVITNSDQHKQSNETERILRFLEGK